MVDIEVRGSKIEGKGIFALRDFKEGEIVLKWNVSKQISKEEFGLFSESEKRYVSFYGGKYNMLPVPERYVNHSCNPNTFVQNFSDVAKRDIGKGEEITSDYAEDLPSGREIKCNCGEKACRKTIKGP